MSRSISFAFVLLFLPTFICLGQQQNSAITVLFAGDIMGHEGQIASAYDKTTNTYSYDNVFKYIRPLISEADLAIGNLEVTLAGPPYTGYPTFCSPDELAAACKRAGFDVLVNANNHSADKGSKGIKRTIKVLDSLNIPHTGTFVSNTARDTLTPLIIERKGIRIALLNYTYGTNGIVLPPPAVVSYIDTIRIASDIRKAKARNSDLVVVFIHWGIEYDSIPSGDQKRTAASIFRNGADIIIGSHPHCLQPMIASVTPEGLNRPLVWSMGNFVSYQRQRRSDGGAMVRLTISKSGGKTVVKDAGYILTWVYIPNENGKRQFYILPCSEIEDNPSFFPYPLNYQEMKLFLTDSRRLLYKNNIGFNELIKAGDMWIPFQPVK
jgi:poly-gamma-glutamate capsule biosynthesis protein CapA/YwtB (metallophosphatase superfamily)